MGVVTARLMFLAFFGLTGTITYNALYLQEHGPRGAATATTVTRSVVSDALPPAMPQRARQPEPETELATELAPEPELAIASAEPQYVAPVSTDLPPLDPATGESQLIVRAVQRELANRGYDVGQIDGGLNDQTRAAISAFQTSQGIAPTGVPNDDLLRQILLGHSVAPGAATGSVAASDSIEAKAAEHATVKGVQQVLADLGYVPGPIDGVWGAETAGAVAAFQRDRGIAETGRITPELLDEVARVTGRDLTKTAANP